jgi:hypothetical protein
MSSEIEYEEIATFIERHLQRLDTDGDGRIGKDEAALAVYNRDFSGRDGLILAFLHAAYSNLMKVDLVLQRNDRKKLDEILQNGINADTLRKVGNLVKERNSGCPAIAVTDQIWLYKLIAVAMTVGNDENHDNVLDKEEIEKALKKPPSSELEKSLLEYLQTNFDTIRGDDNVLTQGEVWAHFSRDDVEAEFLAAACDAILSLMEERSSCASNKSLYATPDKPTQSIRPEAIRQGFNQDCLFLAMAASVAALQPKIIQQAIKPLGDDKFEVIFPAAQNEPFVITNPCDAELSLFCGGSPYGIWPAILEKACGAYCMKSPIRRLAWVRPWNWRPLSGAKDQAPNASFGGWHLFGPVVRDFIQKQPIENFDQLLRQQMKLKKAASLASVASQKIHKDIRPNHAYALISYEWETGVLRVYNPWGRIGRDPRGADSSQGFVDLTLQHAYETFTVIHRIK